MKVGLGHETDTLLRLAHGEFYLAVFLRGCRRVIARGRTVKETLNGTGLTRAQFARDASVIPMRHPKAGWGRAVIHRYSDAETERDVAWDLLGKCEGGT